MAHTPRRRSAWTPGLVVRVLSAYHAISADMHSGMVQAQSTADGTAVETTPPAHAGYVHPVILKSDIDLAIQRLQPKLRTCMTLLFTAPLACQDMSSVAKAMKRSVRTIRRWRNAGLTNLAIDLCGDVTAGRKALETIR